MRRSSVLAALAEIADLYSASGRDTIQYDNRGKHVLELELLLASIRGPRGAVLDVGGGLGVNLLALRRLLPESRLCLLDRFREYTPDNKMGAADPVIAALRGSGIEIHDQDFFSEPAFPFGDGEFDVVTCFDVIEHLPGHPLRVLGDIRRVLRPGGTLLLSGPNSHSAMSWAKMLLGRHPYIDFDSWTSDAYWSHYREYRPHEYRKLLERTGFTVRRTFLSAEPWRTRARTRYHRGFLTWTSPRFYALHAMHMVQSLFPGLREGVYCVAERP